MQENLLASWRQSGQKQDPCPSLLNHNAKYKRLLPPYCDFANGVRSFLDSPNGVVFLPVRLQPPLRFNLVAAPSGAGADACSRTGIPAVDTSPFAVPSPLRWGAQIANARLGALQQPCHGCLRIAKRSPSGGEGRAV